MIITSLHHSWTIYWSNKRRSVCPFSEYVRWSKCVHASRMFRSILSPTDSFSLPFIFPRSLTFISSTHSQLFYLFYWRHRAKSCIYRYFLSSLSSKVYMLVHPPLFQQTVWMCAHLHLHSGWNKFDHEMVQFNHLIRLYSSWLCLLTDSVVSLFGHSISSVRALSSSKRNDEKGDELANFHPFRFRTVHDGVNRLFGKFSTA